MHTCNFAQFIDVVEGHSVNSTLGRAANKRGGFARVGEYDSRWVNASDAKDLVNFSRGGAVKPCTQGG